MKTNSKHLVRTLLSALLVLTMMAGMIILPAQAEAITPATAFESGTGTEADPYIIKTAAQLLYFSEASKTDDFKGKFVKLGADITLNEGTAADWETTAPETKLYPIGKDKAFAGTFDGDNHKISGIYVSEDGDCGLFGDISGATIKNLKIVNSFMQAVKDGWVGGVSGNANGANTTIQNVYVDAIIKSGGNVAGGIIGGCYGTTTFTLTVDGCVFAGTVKLASGKTDAAGIVGNGNTTTGKVHNLVIKNCRVEGTIEADKRCGGILSINNGPATTSITNCVFAGTMPATAGYPFAQSDFLITVANCYSSVLHDTVSGEGETATHTYSYYKTGNGEATEGVAAIYAPADAFESGAGTEADPYVIKTAAQLLYFSEASKTDDFKGKFVKLGADITLNEFNAADWETSVPGNKLYPIGKDKAFAGTFDGDGHTISGIYVNENGDCGFFGDISGATVKNFKIVNSFMQAGAGGWVGGVSGNANGANTTIQNVYVDAIVKSLGNVAGGIIGGCYGKTTFTMTVDGCVFAGTVKMASGKVDAGGIVGDGNSKANNEHDLDIKNCLVTGTIDSDARCGGILSSNKTPGLTSITNCVFAGTLPATIAYPIAQSSDAVIKVTNCYSTVAHDNVQTTGEGETAVETHTYSYYKSIGTEATEGVTPITKTAQIFGETATAKAALTDWTARSNDIIVPTGVATIAPNSAYYNNAASISIGASPAGEDSGEDDPTEDGKDEDKKPVIIIDDEKNDKTDDEVSADVKKGCASVITAGSALFACIAAGALMLAKKKEEEI